MHVIITNQKLGDLVAQILEEVGKFDRIQSNKRDESDT